MLERPSPEIRRRTSTTEEIETATRRWAEEIVKRYIFNGEKVEFADPYPDWSGESKERWGKKNDGNCERRSTKDNR
jgi:hypothetical protein